MGETEARRVVRTGLQARVCPKAGVSVEVASGKGTSFPSRRGGTEAFAPFTGRSALSATSPPGHPAPEPDPPRQGTETPGHTCPRGHRPPRPPQWVKPPQARPGLPCQPPSPHLPCDRCVIFPGHRPHSVPAQHQPWPWQARSWPCPPPAAPAPASWPVVSDTRPQASCPDASLLGHLPSHPSPSDWLCLLQALLQALPVARGPHGLVVPLLCGPLSLRVGPHLSTVLSPEPELSAALEKRPKHVC